MSNKEEYINFIQNHYNEYTNKEIAEILGISDRYVSKLKRENGIPTKIQYHINDIQHQILISGLLGDGNLKKNGLNNYYYRECHSVKESEYLHWKFDKLYPLTKGCSINYAPPRKSTQNPQENFNTKTLSELIPYSKMSNEQIINELNDLGLILYILDDGWKHNHGNGKNYNINLAVHSLTDKEKNLLQLRFKTILDIESKIICSDKNTLSFNKNDNIKFIEVIHKYGLDELDVVYKKF